RHGNANSTHAGRRRGTLPSDARMRGRRQPVSATNAVDVKAFIDQRKMSATQWLLLALCFLVVAADGMDVAIMGFLAPSILQEWGASRASFGVVMSAAPFGLVLGALIAGPAPIDSAARRC